MIKPTDKNLRGWKWVLRNTLSDRDEGGEIPTLTLKHPKVKDHVDLYLTGNHCWYVWDEQGTGGENDATLVEDIKTLPIADAMIEAEDALWRHIRLTYDVWRPDAVTLKGTP